MLTLDDVDVKGKTVLLRPDLNSPVSDGKIQMNDRISEHAKTILELSKKKAKIVVIAHQGRKGEAEYIESMEQHARLLEKCMKKKVVYVHGICEDFVIERIKKLGPGEIMLLKNVRSLDEETAKVSAEEHAKSPFVTRLAPLFDLFVLDALSICHRSHASVVGFPKLIKSCAGRVLQHELEALKKFEKVRKPFVLMLGGCKPSDYLDIIERYVKEKKVQSILACGLFGHLCLYAKGISLGAQEKFLEKKGLLELKEKVVPFLDHIAVPEDLAVEKNKKRLELDVEKFPSEYEVKDIGKKTIKKYCNTISKAKTIFFKGTPGCYLEKNFELGTKKILNAITRASKKKAFSLVAGGDSSLASKKFNARASYVSLSGGALLEYLAGKKLPGLEAIGFY